MCSPSWPDRVEVRLSRNAIAVAAELVDESDRAIPLSIQSIHMQGAKQEVTTVMTDRGYVPRNRWESDGEGYAARVFAIPT